MKKMKCFWFKVNALDLAFFVGVIVGMIIKDINGFWKVFAVGCVAGIPLYLIEKWNKS